MAKRKQPATFADFVLAVERAAVEKCGITAEEAQYLTGQQEVRKIMHVGWGIQNTPSQVLQALLCGVLASWLKHNMKAENNS